MRQIFREADEEEIELEFDTGLIEDRGLLEKVQRLKVDAPSTNSAEVDAQMAKRKLAKLKGQRSDLEDEVEQLRKENKLLKEGSNDESSMKKKIVELQALADEAQQHVSKSKQFLQMKAMLQEKNDTIRSLRKRILKYEPDIDYEDEGKRECKD